MVSKFCFSKLQTIVCFGVYGVCGLTCTTLAQQPESEYLKTTEQRNNKKEQSNYGTDRCIRTFR